MDLSFVQRELDRIGKAIREETDPDRRREFYVARQALSWATEPTGFKSPFAMIAGTKEAPYGSLPISEPAPSEYISPPLTPYPSAQ
jgi:hypothetical protein